MRRLLGFLLALLALPLAAADVPLSARPLAPMHVDAFDAAAAPDAVLLAFSSGPDIYVQRLTAAGVPIDQTAIYLATPDSAPTALTVLWDGGRWAVLWASGIAWIDRDGIIDGPHETGWWPYKGVIADRIVVATKKNATEAQAEFTLAALAGTSEAISLGSVFAPNTNSSWWVVGLDQGLGIVSYRLGPGENGFYNATASVTGPGGDSRNYFFEMKMTGLAVAFLPSGDGGGLLLWDRDGLRGMIIHPDMTASQPFAIGPAEPLSNRIVATSRAAGWDILFRSASGARIAHIERSGSVYVSPLGFPGSFSLWLRVVRTSTSNLLFDLSDRGGISVSRIAGTALDTASVTAIGEAAQRTAHAAAGDGIEIVVWEEEAVDGLVLKATRIVGGKPLDGAGLVVAAYEPWTHPRDEDRFDVAFDGERFVVAWIEGQERLSQKVLARTITAQGTMSDPVRVAEQAVINGVRIAGGGNGRAAVVWSSSVESWLVPLRSGVPGGRVTIGPLPVLPHTSLPQIAASADRYLVVFEETFECRITCAPEGRVWARAFSLDGEALTEPKRLSEQTSLSPQVVSDGRDFFVLWLAYGPDTLARIGPQLEIVWETSPFGRGTLSIEDAELRIDGGRTRAAYSLRGHLERLEPLPIARTDEFVSSLSDRRILVRTASHPDRLVIRPLERPAAADIAIVSTGRIEKGGPYGHIAWFRVEHRGGAPVSRFELWSSNWIYLPNEPEKPYPPLVLNRPLLPGESFEVGLGTYQPDSSPSIHVAADALDPAPANNSAQYGVEERLRRRGTRR